MKKATIGPPIKSDDEGTISYFISDSGFKCLILELPDRQNKPNISRINAGEYYCEMWDSPHHGKVYRLHKQNPDGTHEADIDGHSYVLIHPGNVAGDTALGFASDSEACLLPGSNQALFINGETVGKHVLKKDQHGVASSLLALNQLLDDTKEEPFLLQIIR